MRYWVPSGRVTTPLESTRAPLGISWTQDVGIQPAGVAANGSGEASSRVRLPPTNVTRVPAESTWAQHGRTAPFTATRSYRPAMLGGSLGSTSSHAPTLSSAIPIVITRSAIASPVCNGSPLPRLDVIHEVVVADRGGCAGRHANVGGADEPPVVEDRDTVRGQEIEPLLDRAGRHRRSPSRVEGARGVGGLERDHRVPVPLSDDLLQSSRARVPRPRLGRNVHRHSGHVLHVGDKLGRTTLGRRLRIRAGADHGEDHDAGGRESHDERSLGRWYPVQNYTTRWRCSVTSTRTPSARVWINMLR